MPGYMLLIMGVNATAGAFILFLVAHLLVRENGSGDKVRKKQQHW